MSDLQDLRLALREREVEPLGAHAIAQIMKDGGRLRRRRRLITGATITGSALSLALVAGVITVTAGGGNGYVIVPAATVATTAPPTPSTTSTDPAVRLVSYLGKPPAQFDLRRSPWGWVLQGDGTGTLTLAPKNAADKNPYTFVGKLVVMVDALPMETSDPEGSTLVTDQPAHGRLTLSAEGVQTFTYPLTGQRRVLISIPRELGWGSKEITTFANGVTVHDDVQLSLG